MVNCKMCGKCCHYEYNGKLKKCKHLVKIKNRTLCRIYKNRIGTVLEILPNGDKIICQERIKIKKHYKGCPYNERIRI